MLWKMTQNPQGQTVVSWGRKTKTFSSEEAALAFVREKRLPTDRVVREEEDGYRTQVTRRRWRNRAPGM